MSCVPNTSRSWCVKDLGRFMDQMRLQYVILAASGKVRNTDPLKEHSTSAERAWRAKSVARASEPPASVASKVPCLLSSFSAD